MPEWPSPSFTRPLNPEAIKPRATGPQWLWAGRARDPFLTPPPNAEACGRPGRRRAKKPCHAASAFCTLYSGYGATTCRSATSRASSTSSRREVCTLLRRTPHPPRLNAAQEPAGAPKSLATGRLAHQAVHQGWLGGPGHRKGSVGGRGFAPTPNPEPPRLGGGLVYR